MEWKFITVPNEQLPKDIPALVCDLEAFGAKVYKATVPGCFISDMITAGDLPNLEFSQNILLAQKTENLHVFYYTEIQPQRDEYLHFEGIDTIADIYVNGKAVQSCDNMFLPVDIHADWAEGKNKVVVHIKPIGIASRKHPLPASAVAPFYTQEGLYMRKAISSFGWDILPRLLTAGIYKPVSLVKTKQDSIDNVFISTARIDYEKMTSRLRVYYQLTLNGDFARDYTIKIVGKCGESVFEKETTVWHEGHSFSIDVSNLQIWNPKNYGEPNLYDIDSFLYYKGTLVDRHSFRYGVRMARLEHDKEHFRFVINDKPIFVMGSNWVPTSYFAHEQTGRLDKALDLLDESGANMVRVWGGGYYEDEKFYDFCDSHGILVWQDFMMACAIYPQEEAFASKIHEEACYQIRRLRNHCSIALWCGDNECDQAMVTWSDFIRDPDSNILTRKVLPSALNNLDFTRSYLPSSPHIFSGYTQHNCVERHLWTRTEHFASPFYLNTTAKFISEIGYTAFPGISSLQRFLKTPEKILREDGSATDEYVLHGTAPELNRGAWYDHKVPCACKFAGMVFSPLSEDLDTFTKQSQYTQAEAYKTWIEHARTEEINGILLWNLLDGWPQVSEAMVDYYFCKKASFNFVKNAQRPVSVIIKQQDKGVLQIVLVNGERSKATVTYRVMLGDKIVADGVTDVLSDEIKQVKTLHTDGESNFYTVQYSVDGIDYHSHYQENPVRLDIATYQKNIESVYGKR